MIVSTEHEDTNGIDPDAFASSLFESPAEPLSDEPANSLATPTESAGGSPTPPPAPAAAAAAGLTAEAWESLPKSWKREMEAHWKTSSPDVRRYVHEREAQVTQGITQYRESADNWRKVMAPFQEILKEYPNANPQEILATLANNHIRMVKSSPEERREHALALARGYGVDFATATAVAGTPAEGAAQGFTPAQIDELKRTLGPTMEAAQQAQRFVQDQQQQAAMDEVDKFFSDKKNEFVNDVADDIQRILQKGQASSLSEAYELAVMRNPEVKARYIAGLAAKAAPPTSPKPKLPNVKSSATPISAPKNGSMDDTFASVLAKHYQ